MNETAHTRETAVTPANPPETAADPDTVFALFPPIVRECCGSGGDGYRYDLRYPFVDGDHVYVTDGRIAVRVPTPPGAETVLAALRGDRLAPKAAPLFEGDWSPDGVPVPDPSAAPACETCKGTGRCESVACPDCGRVVPTPGHPAPCYACDATGIDDPSETGAAVGRDVVAWRFLSLLGRHGATLYPSGPGAGPKQPVRFTTPDGVEGLVMPLTVPEPTPTPSPSQP